MLLPIIFILNMFSFFYILTECIIFQYCVKISSRSMQNYDVTSIFIPGRPENANVTRQLFRSVYNIHTYNTISTHVQTYLHTYNRTKYLIGVKYKIEQ